MMWLMPSIPSSTSFAPRPHRGACHAEEDGEHHDLQDLVVHHRPDGGIREHMFDEPVQRHRMRVDPGIHPRRHLVRADAGFRKVATSCISLKIELRSFCVCLLMRQIRALRYFWPVWQEPSRGTHTGEWANPPDAFIFGQA